MNAKVSGTVQYTLSHMKAVHIYFYYIYDSFIEVWFT